MQFRDDRLVRPLSMYPAGYGENPKVPLSFVALASQGFRAWCFISCASTVIPALHLVL